MLVAVLLALSGLSCCGGEPQPSPIYCYRTLAAPDCHAAPIPGENHRLIGYYGPAPDAGAAGPSAD